MGCLGLAGTMDGTSQQAAGSQTEPDGTATQQQFHLSLGLAPFGQPTVCNTLILFLPLPSHGTGAYRAGCYGSCKRDTHIVNVLSPLIDFSVLFQRLTASRHTTRGQGRPVSAVRLKTRRDAQGTCIQEAASRYSTACLDPPKCPTLLKYTSISLAPFSFLLLLLRAGPLCNCTPLLIYRERACTITDSSNTFKSDYSSTHHAPTLLNLRYYGVSERNFFFTASANGLALGLSHRRSNISTN